MDVTGHSTKYKNNALKLEQQNHRKTAFTFKIVSKYYVLTSSLVSVVQKYHLYFFIMWEYIFKHINHSCNILARFYKFIINVCAWFIFIYDTLYPVIRGMLLIALSIFM